MKILILSVTLIFSSFLAQAQTVSEPSKALTVENNVIAKRLANKNISEVIELVLRLQMECQQDRNADVCEGVINVVNVLEYRLKNAADSMNDDTLAFIQGLMEGVLNANKQTKAGLNT
jgi:hypothetical protein